MSTSEARSPRAYGAVEQLAGVEVLDGPADAIAKAIRDKVPKPAKDVLAGSWLGHALHPVLTDATIGTWTSALLLDWLGGEGGKDGADRLVALGLAASLPTFWSGWVDWADSTPGNAPVKRVGIFHALANGSGAALMAASLVARRRGARGRGRVLAVAAGGCMTAGAHLGGHLSFGEGIGVNQTAFESPPEDWTDVLADADLSEGRPRCARVGGVAVLVVRDRGAVRALSDRCSHRGGALHEGEVADGCVTCPLHGSVFALEDGSVRSGPAAYPQPVWEARVRAGRVEVRPAG
jgi:nitrite reductase/ring-hydroxylating ferredoxin subunit